MLRTKKSKTKERPDRNISFINLYPLFVLITFVLAVLLVNTANSQQDIKRTNAIFIVDTSKTMRKDGLFEKVKQALDDYVSKTNIGDHILIMAFDDNPRDVIESDVQGSEDLKRIRNSIQSMEANGEWTYMTSAIDVSATRIDKMQRDHPNNLTQIVLMTDGKNDPPPEHRDPQNTISFEDIVKNHFDTFTKNNTYIYFLTFGKKVDPRLEALGEKLHATNNASERPKPVVIPQLTVSPKSLTFENPARGQIEKFELTVTATTDSILELNAISSGNNNLTVVMTPAIFKLTKENPQATITGEVTIGEITPGETAKSDIVISQTKTGPVPPYSVHIVATTTPENGIIGRPETLDGFTINPEDIRMPGFRKGVKQTADITIKANVIESNGASISGSLPVKVNIISNDDYTFIVDKESLVLSPESPSATIHLTMECVDRCGKSTAKINIVGGNITKSCVVHTKPSIPWLKIFTWIIGAIIFMLIVIAVIKLINNEEPPNSRSFLAFNLTSETTSVIITRSKKDSKGKNKISFGGHPSVSPNHATISLNENKIILSPNSTRVDVNDQRYTQATIIKNGDKVTIGEFELQCQLNLKDMKDSGFLVIKAPK